MSPVSCDREWKLFVWLCDRISQHWSPDSVTSIWDSQPDCTLSNYPLLYKKSLSGICLSVQATLSAYSKSNTCASLQSMIRVTCYSTKYTIPHSLPPLSFWFTPVSDKMCRWFSGKLSHVRAPLEQVTSDMSLWPPNSQWPAWAVSDPCCYKLTGQSLSLPGSRSVHRTLLPPVVTITH